MIHTVLPLSVGNALRLFLSPPAGALRWRVLRKGTDGFAGPDDAAAVKVYEGDDKVVLDTLALQNGVPAHYRPFYWIAGAWVDGGATAVGTPVATYQDASTDVVNVLRDRIDAGMAVEMARGTFRHPSNRIQVMVGPPQINSNLRMPLVTVQQISEQRAERVLAEGLDISFDAIGGAWSDAEGWLAHVTVAVTAWSLNPSERIELRKALRRVVVANLPVFDAAGMLQIEFSIDDQDAVNDEFKAPLFMASGTFTCVAPVVVRSNTLPIREIETNLIADL